MELTVTKLPWYGQVGAFVAVALAGVGVFYWYYAAPAQAAAAARELELQKLRADINRGLAVARQLPEFQQQVKELEGRLESLRAVLPEEKDVADLLRRIQTLATQSSLAIRSFRPEAVATRDLHIEWPIRLEIDGSYHNLGAFFDRISKFPRLINVGGIVIRAKDNPTPGSTIVAECTATTFVLREAAPAESQDAAAPAQTVAQR